MGDSAHRRDLRGERGDQTTALRIGLVLHPLKRLTIQLAQQQRKFFVKFHNRGSFSFACDHRKGETPNLITFFFTQRFKKLGKAGDQIRLSEQNVDGKLRAQFFTQFM